MTAHDLAHAAQSAHKSTRRYTPLEPYIPAVDILRRKGWSWEAIHTWLLSQGQRVQATPASFAASMGRCYRRWISRETIRLSPRLEDASLPAEGDGKISAGRILLTEPPPIPPSLPGHIRVPGKKRPPARPASADGETPRAPSNPTPPPAQSQAGS